MAAASRPATTAARRALLNRTSPIWATRSPTRTAPGPASCRQPARRRWSTSFRHGRRSIRTTGRSFRSTPRRFAPTAGMPQARGSTRRRTTPRQHLVQRSGATAVSERVRRSRAAPGLFGANDGSTTWLFVVNTDAANSILYSSFDGDDVVVVDRGSRHRQRHTCAPLHLGRPGRRRRSDRADLDRRQRPLRCVHHLAGDGAPTRTAPPQCPCSRRRTGRRCSEPSRSARARRTIAASAACSSSSMTRTSVRVQTTPPFQYTWDSRTVANGTHSIAAIGDRRRGKHQHGVCVGVGVQPSGDLRRQRVPDLHVVARRSPGRPT